MSKIGKKPITIPEKVEVQVDGKQLEIKGEKGALRFVLPPFVRAEKKDATLTFTPENNSKQAQASWGTARALAQNAIDGVTKEFEKTLELEGVGYRVLMEGATLVLHLGFSHPIKVSPPEGIKISVLKNTMTVSGINKDLVGRTAAQIRAFRKVEPYKGKGIRYKGEIVRRKAGKKVAGATK